MMESSLIPTSLEVLLEEDMIDMLMKLSKLKIESRKEALRELKTYIRWGYFKKNLIIFLFPLLLYGCGQASKNASDSPISSIPQIPPVISNLQYDQTIYVATRDSLARVSVTYSYNGDGSRLITKIVDSDSIVGNAIPKGSISGTFIDSTFYRTKNGMPGVLNFVVYVIDEDGHKSNQLRGRVEVEYKK